MKTIPVKSIRGNYKIVVGKGLLEKTGGFLRALGLSGKAFVVTQAPVAARYLKPVLKSLKAAKITAYVHNLPDGETAKSGAELFKIYHALLDKQFERRDTVVALGGGVTGDLSGFAAATYLRGISFVNIPTTLLAQVDSAIGGKTAINLEEGKNLVGAFYPPRIVISDIRTLRSLPERELRASLGEVVKYGMISDAKLFRFLEANMENISNEQVFEKIVAASSGIKAGVVSRDEHETKGERMILNLGHTFGHGFEQALEYRKLYHGEAVSVGMVCAGRLALRLKIFKAADFKQFLNLLLALRLPVSVRGLNVDLEKVLSAMQRDKKKKAGSLRFVLPTGIGKVVIRQDIPTGIVREILLEAGAK